MEGFTLWKARARLTRELASWRMAAIGLLALAVLVNVAMMARITHLEDAREADAVRHQEELRQAESGIRQDIHLRMGRAVPSLIR